MYCIPGVWGRCAAARTPEAHSHQHIMTHRNYLTILWTNNVPQCNFQLYSLVRGQECMDAWHFGEGAVPWVFPRMSANFAGCPGDQRKVVWMSKVLGCLECLVVMTVGWRGDNGLPLTFPPVVGTCQLVRHTLGDLPLPPPPPPWCFILIDKCLLGCPGNGHFLPFRVMSGLCGCPVVGLRDYPATDRSTHPASSTARKANTVWNSDRTKPD